MIQDEFHPLNDDVRRLYSRMMHALWKLMTTEEPEWAKRFEQAEEAYQTMLASDSMRERLQRLYATRSDDSVVKRALDMLSFEMAEYQIPDKLRHDIASSWNELYGRIHTFTADVDGQPMSAKQVLHLLRTVEDAPKREAIWLACMKQKEQVAPKLRQLVKMRNQAARLHGYANYYEMKLEALELNAEDLMQQISQLRAGLDGTYVRVKARLDARLAETYQCPPDQICAWHYSHPTRPEWRPDTTDIGSYIPESVLTVIRRTLEQRGVELGRIWSQSDFVAREGKSSASFCLNLDRADDIRVSCHVVHDVPGLTVLLHELGHAWMESRLDPDLPFLLRQPSPFMSEAIAVWMERLLWDPEYWSELNEDTAYVPDLVARYLNGIRINGLLRLYETMTVVMFERQLYENPDQSLDGLWWDLVSDIQRIPKPSHAVSAWAAVPHLTTLPVYYQNYLLGELLAAQIKQSMEQKHGQCHHSLAFADIGDGWCRPGISLPWHQIVRQITGENIQTKHLIREFQFMSKDS